MGEIDFDAIVIGAGFAGATAARDLRDRGLAVLVVEGSARVGGRTFSRPFKGRTELIECGGTWVNPAVNPLVGQEIARYGIELAFDEDEEPHGTSTFFTAGERRDVPIGVDDLYALEEMFFRFDSCARRLLIGPPIYDQPVADLDVSARELLAGIELPRAGHDLVYSLLGAMIGGDPDEASMLGPVSKTAAFGSPLKFLFGGPAGKGYGSAKFRNGTAEMVRAMLDGSGAELWLESPVEAIADGPDTVTVTIKGKDVTARACVVAMPSNVIRKVDISPALSPEKMSFIGENHLGTGFKTMMIADHVPEGPMAFGMAPLQNVIPEQRLEDGTWLLTGFGTNAFWAVDPTSREDTEAALRHYFPDARVLACDGHDWVTDPLFDGAWRLDRAGRGYDGPRVMKEPEGHLFFAGADFDDSLWRVSIEGAVHSGHRAANQAGRLLKAS